MVSTILHCIRKGGPARGTVALQKKREGAILQFSWYKSEFLAQDF